MYSLNCVYTCSALILWFSCLVQLYENMLENQRCLVRWQWVLLALKIDVIFEDDRKTTHKRRYTLLNIYQFSKKGSKTEDIYPHNNKFDRISTYFNHFRFACVSWKLYISRSYKWIYSKKWTYSIVVVEGFCLRLSQFDEKRKTTWQRNHS